MTRLNSASIFKKRGFTLIEAVMVIVMVGAVVGAIGYFIARGIDIWDFVSFRDEVLSEGRTALDRMVKEALELKDDASVFSATSTEFDFTDINDNRIKYSISGDTLYRNSDILAGDVDSISFHYYDVNGNELLSPAVYPSSTDIWRIEIELSFSKGSEEMTLKSGVHPRNIFR